MSENVTLDGVIQDPAGDEGFKHGDKRPMRLIGTQAMGAASPTSPTSPSGTPSGEASAKITELG